MKLIKFRAWSPKYDCVYDWFKVSTLPIGDLMREDLEWMQSIGLKDKNDKEIFEGDIVRAKSNRTKKLVTGIIGWRPWEAAFRLVVEGDYCYRLDDIHAAKIIGNIYENAEFLIK